MNSGRPEAVIFSSFEKARKVLDYTDPFSRLASLSRSIGGVFKREPGYLLLTVGALYMASQFIRALHDQSIDPGFAATDGQNPRSVKVVETPLVVREEGCLTYPYGVRIREPLGVNVRVFPDVEIGARVKTGKEEPFYEVLQYSGYAAEPVVPVRAVRAIGEDIWARGEKGYFAVLKDGELLGDIEVNFSYNYRSGQCFSNGAQI